MIELPGTPLSAADLEGLQLSWIDHESAARALLRRVTSLEGAELIGQKDGKDYSGITFPNVWPGESHPREYRLRRDSPDVTYVKGVRKYLCRYLSPPGRGNLLFFVPGTSAELLDDTDLPIVFTEGEKKAIALSRLAWYGISDASERPRFLVVGLPGVWGWRGTVGKENGPRGERLDVKGVIPDFDRIGFTERKAIIAYDSDVKTNPKVRAARLELARHLIHERGAQAHFAELPDTAADGKTGIDDLLASVGPEKVLELIERAKRANDRGRRVPILANIANDAEFFHTQDMKLYSTFTVNGHKETWQTRSQGFKRWLAMRYYRDEQKPLSTQALQEAVAVCDARAHFDGPVCDVGLRLIADGQNVYLDLADDAWRVIELNGAGRRVLSESPVKFRRARGMAPLPVPLSGSIRELRRFVNAGSDQNWILMVAWLMAALSPSGPYPILILQGEQGSAKSTVARVLRLLVDPSTAPLRSVPRDERDLMIAANNSWVLSFDNLSGIPQWLSDALCRLSTGGGFATRELHTDDEEVLFDATRPIILNGIDDIAGNADLADRALIVTLPQVHPENTIPEKVFWREFGSAQPRILGGLLDAVSMALRNLEHVEVPQLPRMADFARWVCAGAPALPFNQEEFLQAYSENRRESVSLSIETSPVATAIQTLVPAGDWEGTATQLLQALNMKVNEETRKAKTWPKDARTMSSRIRRLAPLLRQTGWDVGFGIFGHQSAKLIRLARKAVQASDRCDCAEA